MARMNKSNSLVSSPRSTTNTATATAPVKAATLNKDGKPRKPRTGSLGYFLAELPQAGSSTLALRGEPNPKIGGHRMFATEADANRYAKQNGLTGQFIALRVGAILNMREPQRVVAATVVERQYTL